MEKENDNEIIKISEWHTPATDYPEKVVGSAKIVHGFYNYGYFHNYGVRGYELFEVVKQIPITSLEIKCGRREKIRDSRIKCNWETWMVDDPPHFWSMQDYARNSAGKVLVAGLGLGLVTGELLHNIDVDSITVIEKNKDVIDLISPLLPVESGKDVEFNIINKDFYDFIHESSDNFDRIIVDLWTSGSIDETKKILKEEVLPLSIYLKIRYPDASIVFHGFKI